MTKRNLIRIRALSKTPFEAALAFVAMVASLVYFVDPTTVQASALSHTAQTLLPAWEALYAAGGMLMLVGLMYLSARLELAGLSMFSSAVLINAISIVHFTGTTGVLSALTFAALWVASVVRAVVLLRFYRVSTGAG